MPDQSEQDQARMQQLQDAIIDLAGALSAIYQAHTLTHAQQIAREALNRIHRKYLNLFDEE